VRSGYQGQRSRIIEESRCICYEAVSLPAAKVLSLSTLTGMSMRLLIASAAVEKSPCTRLCLNMSNVLDLCCAFNCGEQLSSEQPPQCHNPVAREQAGAQLTLDKPPSHVLNRLEREASMLKSTRFVSNTLVTPAARGHAACNFCVQTRLAKATHDESTPHARFKGKTLNPINEANSL
jgi:hypothetical protein